MTNARPRRAGHGTVDAQSIKKVTEICKDASPEDAQAALTEHNGDVQAAVMSLLDNPFQSVEKKKRRPQRPVEREERHSNREFPYRDNDRRGHDRSRGGGRGRGGDRSNDNAYDGPPARGRGRGGRGRGRGPPREPEPVQPVVDIPPADNDFGSEAPAISPPGEEVPSPAAHRVQHQSAPRPVSSAVVSDGSISWAQKIKERAAPVQPMYEPEQGNEYDERAYHEPQTDGRGMHNGVANEVMPEDPAQVLQQPQDDSFGSGYGHDSQANAWESTHQSSAWSTSVTASPELPLQDPHLNDSQPQSNQHQSFDQPPPGIPVNSQTFNESKPFDLRDLAGTLPQSSTVQEESTKPADFFELAAPQEVPSQPPGFGPPGLQQNSPLSMFTNRSNNRSSQPAEAPTVQPDARDPAALMNGSFGDFGHGMGAPVSMPPPSEPQAHHAGAQVSAQQAHHSHTQAQAPQQPAQSQDIQSAQPTTGQQNQQEPSNGQSQAPQLPPDHSQHSQHVHSFESAFPGHAAPDSHRGSNAKVNSSAAMFMPEHSPGDRLADGPQSQAGPQNTHSQDQDKAYASENKGNNTNSEQQNQQLPNQAYQQLPHDVSNWGVPAMQADLYGMQRPGSAQLTPPGMGQMVPGMGQMPNQMQAQYPMNPNMPAPGYAAPGYPPTNYPQQMGYAPGPYMQPGYNMQYPNSGYPYPGQMAPQAYAPSPSGPQMYGGPSGGGFGKQQGYMGDYNARGSVASGAGGVPGAGSGRGRGRGKNQKGRMAPGFSPQGMHGDPYHSSQGGYMDPGWMAQNQRFDTGFGKDKNVQPQPQYPPFAPGGYENPAPYGYGQFAQHSQFPQQTWNGEKSVGAAKGNF